MAEHEPIKVAIIGGGCASMAAAFELSRPEHQGKYAITVYQLGWRLGGKGASGRGVGDRIEEHGLHVWLGFYENAFRMIRECYRELNRDPKKCRFSDWQDAFAPEAYVGIADRSRGNRWQHWLAYFPPGDGLPGDPLSGHNPFSLTNYLFRIATLLRALLVAVQVRETRADSADRSNKRKRATDRDSRSRADESAASANAVQESIARLVKYGVLATTAGLVEAAGLIESMLSSVPQAAESLSGMLETIASTARQVFEELTKDDDEIARLWEVIDLVLAIMLGMLRSGVMTDPRGLDAINDLDCREWLRRNGASQRSVNSALVRGLYDLAFAYEDGDFARPRLAAGQAIRGSLRMFLTYRGALFWKMRAGMGEVVFAPLYETLKKRKVSFQFFHRLKDVRLAKPDSLARKERCYVEALKFEVQAEVVGRGEYRPLIDVRGLPCWPSKPDYRQLKNGARLEQDGCDLESHWDKRKVAMRTLRVAKDFDYVVLGVGLGAIPYVCRDLIQRDSRWRDMTTHVKTVATQAFQVWMREDMASLGWKDPQATVSGFAQPFDTWADMRQLIPEENLIVRPRAISYFCSTLPDPQTRPSESDASYPKRRREEVRANAIRFMNEDLGHLWPGAIKRPGLFRWDVLIDPRERNSTRRSSRATSKSFDSQFWSANVNPSDRYVLCVPGSVKYRISPLDNTYDNLTVAGDWTDCGFNEGCVEAATMSGKLAAHAIAGSPRLDEIIGYDHP